MISLFDISQGVRPPPPETVETVYWEEMHRFDVMIYQHAAELLRKRGEGREVTAWQREVEREWLR